MCNADEFFDTDNFGYSLVTCNLNKFVPYYVHNNRFPVQEYTWAADVQFL
jgi:hypothetical protein